VPLDTSDEDVGSDVEMDGRQDSEQPETPQSTPEPPPPEPIPVNIYLVCIINGKHMLDGKQKLVTFDDNYTWDKFDCACLTMCQSKLPKGVKWDDDNVDIKFGWHFCTTKSKQKANAFIDITDTQDFNAMVGEIRATKNHDEYTLKIRAIITIKDTEKNVESDSDSEIQMVFPIISSTNFRISQRRSDQA
jgi:hypothetical protein